MNTVIEGQGLLFWKTRYCENTLPCGDSYFEGRAILGKHSIGVCRNELNSNASCPHLMKVLIILFSLLFMFVRSNFWSRSGFGLEGVCPCAVSADLFTLAITLTAPEQADKCHKYYIIVDCFTVCHFKVFHYSSVCHEVLNANSSQC